MDITRISVSQHLRTIRELSGLSPEQVAEKIQGEVSPSYIRRLEKGKNSPTVDLLLLLCRAYGIDPIKFFSSMQNGNGKNGRKA